VQIFSTGLRRCFGSADLRRALQRICKTCRDFWGVSQISAVKLNANFGICWDLSRRGSVRPSKRENQVRVSCCAEKPHLFISYLKIQILLGSSFVMINGLRETTKAYTRDLHRLLAIVEDCRQKKLEAVGAIEKRRALKIQHKAEREEDPAQMRKIYG
jgi:hypothetical protein